VAVRHEVVSTCREGVPGYCVEGVMGVFLMEIQPAEDDVDHHLWVIVGDLSPAYLVCDDARTPSEALLGYVEEMRTWLRAARGEKGLGRLIPVYGAGGQRELPMNEETIDLMERRLQVLERSFAPAIQRSDARLLRRPEGQHASIGDRLK
jgi:hypothetical protein